MKFTYKHQKKNESQAEYYKNNIINFLSSLPEEDAPILIELETDIYYSFNSNTCYNTTVYTANSNYLQTVQFSNKAMENIWYFERIRVSSNHTPVKFVEEFLKEYDPCWIFLGGSNPHEYTYTTNGDRRMLFINLKNWVQHCHSLPNIFTIPKNSFIKNFAYRPFLFDDMSTKRMLLYQLQFFGRKSNTETFELDTFALETIINEVSRLLKEYEFNGKDNKKLRDFLNRLSITHTRGVTMTHFAYIMYDDFLAQKIVDNITSLASTKKAMNTLEKTLKTYTDEIDALPDCDRLLIELSDLS